MTNISYMAMAAHQNPTTKTTGDAPRALIVIPVFNHGATLRRVAEGALATGMPVLVVNDGSTDGGPQTLSGLPVQIIHFTRNKGKGAAILAAAEWAGRHAYTHLITIDADGQHDPLAASLFLEKIRRQPWSIVVGARDLAGACAPGASRFGRHFSNFWLRLVTGRHVSDSQCGMRAYPVAALLVLHSRAHRYHFEIEILVRASWAGLRLDSVPIPVYYPREGARISHFHPLRDNLLISWTYTCAVTRRLFGGLLPDREVQALRAMKNPMESSDRDNSHYQYRSPDYGGRLGFAIFHALIRLTGVRPAYGLLAFVLVYYVCIRTSVRRAMEYYLRRRFPKQSPPKRLLIRYRYLTALGRTLIDQSVMGIRGPDFFTVDFPGQEELFALAQRRRGLILLTSHVGAWQTAMASMNNLGVPVSFQFQREPHTEGRHFFDLAGRRDQFRLISPAGFLGGVVELTQALRAGECVAVMGDRAWGARTAKVPFLGTPADFPIIPYQLALATSAEIVVLLTARTGRLAYRIDCECITAGRDWTAMPREEAIRELLARYVAALERHLEKYPFMWFNFFDIWNLDRSRQGPD